MGKKYGTLIICVAILVLCFTGTASAETWYVDDEGGADFTRIQDAINNATDGDTIIVRDGTYAENVNVNRRLTIRAGNDSANYIVQAVTPNAHVFEVTADYVNISGFTVKGATRDYYAGIHLNGVYHCNISNNICSNNDNGIYLYKSTNNSISNNNCSDNGYGTFLEVSTSNSISNNICSNNAPYGIFLRDSTNNSISNNICSSNNVYGITLDHSNDNSISNNICSNNDDGINLDDSTNNSLLNNNCSNNDDSGIYLKDSNNNKLKGNVMLENGIVIWGDSLSDYMQEIDTSNTVNGKPIYYWQDIEGEKIPDGVGQVILMNCKNVVVENQNLNNTSIGIQIACSSHITIKNNTCSNNMDNGISLRYSTNNSISNNTCSNNDEGIYLYKSNNNNISNNICLNNEDGILLGYSKANKLTGNVMLKNGIIIYGDSLGDYRHEIDESNTVNGKPVYYWKDVEGGRVPDGAGQVILVNCSNIRVENQNINNASIGIQTAFSSYITLKNNNCLNNERGIHLDYSNNNSISNNTCSNNEYGFNLWHSKNNSISKNTFSNNVWTTFWDSKNTLIYLNNFINNRGYFFYKPPTTWNSAEEITYTYNETTYTNYLGNYWDDYRGIDADGDGIGDTQYGLYFPPTDYYPLMEPWENYFA